MENSTTILNTVPFSNLINWSFQYLVDSEFSYNQDYELVSLGSFLTRNKTAVNIQDDIEYKRVTVSAKNRGISLRDTLSGKKIGTKKQFVVSENQFLLSKIDARNGAFGIVPNEVSGAIITGNFWTYDVDYSVINPTFLSLMVTTPEFIEFCERASNGTTNRHYLQEDLFLAQQIPLPTLKEQNRIVNNYNLKLNLAVQQEEKANKLQDEIESYLYNSLGIKKLVKKESITGLQFVNYEDVSRWDTLFLIGNLPTLESTYPIANFSEVISTFNKGEDGSSIRINSKDFPNEDFHYIGMEHIEKETGRLIELNKVKGEEIKSQTLKVPSNYFLYGKLRPYLNKYWINETDIDNIICSSEFFVFDIYDSIDKQFFKYVLSSSFIQTQISDKTSGARMPRINEAIFFNLQFPLPPINKQEEISQKLLAIEKEIIELKQKAVENKSKAIKEFELEIFSN